MTKAYLVAGLLYGDEGKGATVDYLVREHNAGLVIRYNGGPQAGHNVVLEDGRHHTFSQFGSGTFVPDVHTFLSKYMLVNPITMMREEEHLREIGIKDAYDRTIVDRECIVITPFHRAVNRIKEWSRTNKHGSCGMGVGQAREDALKFPEGALRVGDLYDKGTTLTKLRGIYGRCLTSVNELTSNLTLLNAPPDDLTVQLMVLDRPEYVINLAIDGYYNWVHKIKTWDLALPLFIRNYGNIVFEGAQGLLLDETLGEENHNTWTDTTFGNASKILIEGNWDYDIERIGVTRSYLTRHGEGMFKEDPSVNFPEPHNDDSGFQGKFKKGILSSDLLNYAIHLMPGGIDYLAMNHCEYIGRRGVEGFELDKPIKLFGVGPTAKDRVRIPLETKGERIIA